MLISLLRDLQMPNGIADVGYNESDIDTLVAGTMKQQRLLATAPREVDEHAAHQILTASLTHY